MKVRAVRLGYYDLKRRREGEIFELKDPKDFSDVNRTGKGVRAGWMERLDAETNESVKTSKRPKAKPYVNQDVI